MRSSSAKTVEVIKFRETGVIALMRETIDYIDSGEAAADGVKPETARFVDDIPTSCYKVVFDRG